MLLLSEDVEQIDMQTGEAGLVQGAKTPDDIYESFVGLFECG
jgi:hypothetical protein